MNVPVVTTIERARKANSKVCFHADGSVVLHEQASDISLFQMEMRLLLERCLHAKLVCLLVALRAGRSHARPFASIQHSKLDAGGVSIDSHGTAECIDLTDHVAFGESAHCRIARHLPDSVGVLGKHQRLTTEAGCCHSCFNPGMACADHDHVIRSRIFELAHIRISSQPRFQKSPLRATCSWNTFRRSSREGSGTRTKDNRLGQPDGSITRKPPFSQTGRSARFL